MSTVKSDINIAQTYATQLKNACQSLTAIAAANQNDLTTLQGDTQPPTLSTKGKNSSQSDNSRCHPNFRTTSLCSE